MVSGTAAMKLEIIARRHLYDIAASSPIPIVNASPIQLLFLQAVPARPRTLPRGATRLALTTTVANTLLKESSGSSVGWVDMEMIRTTLDLGYGLNDRLEINLSLPAAYSGGGGMDHFILDVERAFGNARKVREEQSAHQYHFDVRTNGRRLLGGGDRASGLGDATFGLKGMIMPEADLWPGFGARLAVKLPTASQTRGLGSGHADFGAGTDITFFLNVGRGF